MKSLSIRSRLFVGMMAVILGFLIVTTLMVGRLLGGYLEEETARGLQRARDAYDRFSVVRASRLRERAGGLARDLALGGSALERHGAQALVYERLEKEPFFVLADLESETLYDPFESPFDSVELRALRGTTSLLTGDHYSGIWSYAGGTYQVVAVPLTENERIVGFLALGDAIDANLARTLVEVTGHDVMIVQGRELLASWSADRADDSGEDAHARSIFAEMPASPGAGAFHRLDVGEQSFLLHPVPMDAGRTDLVLIRSLDPALTHFAKIRSYILFTSLALAAIAFLVSHRISSRTAGPILDLSRAARDMAQGKLDAEVESIGVAEVGELGRAFNKMSREIQRLVGEALDKAKAAEQANATKSAFLANMSHEIRTPLNGIIGFTDLVLQDEITDTQRENVRLIKRSGEDLLEIVNDILDFSKIEAGQLEFEETEFHLERVLKRSADPLRPAIDEKGLSFRIELDVNLPDVLVGPVTRLQQIVRNYLSNAFKFTDSGSICLRAARQSEDESSVMLRVSVTDTGMGISEDKLELLFRPFSQIDGTSSRRFGGTGLGLAICKELAELMGGSVGVESIVGAGSVFWFTARLTKVDAVQEPRVEHGPAPLAPPLPTAAPESDGPLPGEEAVEIDPRLRERRGGHRILVVEDHPVNQRMAGLILDRGGWPHTIVGNGEEALDLLGTETFDLILMDCQMPVLDGYEATQRIRTDEAGTGRRVPIIALTANTMSGDRERCLEAGMDDFVGKPIRTDQLLEKLDHWLDPERAGSVPAEEA